jgi:hypothetical protein
MNTNYLSLFILFFIYGLEAHSMMTCAVKSGNQCLGAVRNSQASFTATTYRFDGTNACQPEARGVSNLASKYSPQCSSCGAMGSVQSGSTFRVEWKARNHAVSNQNPGVVKVYMAGPIQNGQTDDFTPAVFRSNKICEGPFINCGNGANVDTLGDDVNCFLDCTVPSTTPGTYSIWWNWDWTQNDGNIYTTCADIAISGAALPNQQSSQNQQTMQQTSQNQQTNQQTNQQSNLQTSQNQQSNQMNTVSSGAGCGDLSSCITACGEGNVLNCSCENAQLLIECGSDGDKLRLSVFFVLIFAFLAVF